MSNEIKPEDRTAIETILYKHYWWADHQRELCADLYTEDAYVTSSHGHEMRGREAIRADAANREPGEVTRHIMTSLQLTPNDDGTIETTTVMIVYRKMGETARGVLQDCTSTFQRNDEGTWQVSRRHVDFVVPIDPKGSWYRVMADRHDLTRQWGR